MRKSVGAVVVLLGATVPCLGQGDKPSSVTPEQREAVSDRKAAEIRSASRQAQKRQDSIDAGYRALMLRWSLAVCIGCEPRARKARILHTYPLRVLAGFSAAEDDARERSGRLPL